MNKDINPEVLIRRIRDLDSKQMIKICTSGSCYKFYKILKTVFPDAIPYFNKDRNHIYTKINNTYYDINGKVRDKSDIGEELNLDEKKYCFEWAY